MKQRTTISEIAAQLGVSPSTVSRALHNSPTISAQRKAEVWKLAESLGLRIEKPSGNQARHCSGIIACVVPSISHPFFVDIIENLKVFAPSGDMIFCFAVPTPRQPSSTLSWKISSKSAWMVLCSSLPVLT